MMKPLLVITVRIDDEAVILCRKYACKWDDHPYNDEPKVSRRRQREIIFTQKLGEIGVYEFLVEHQFNVVNLPFEHPFVKPPSREDRLKVVHGDDTLYFDCHTNRHLSSYVYHKPWFIRPGTAVEGEYVALCEVRKERLGYYVDIYAVVPRKVDGDAKTSGLVGAFGMVKFNSLEKLAAEELFPILKLLKSEN